MPAEVFATSPGLYGNSLPPMSSSSVNCACISSSVTVVSGLPYRESLCPLMSSFGSSFLPRPRFLGNFLLVFLSFSPSRLRASRAPVVPSSSLASVAPSLPKERSRAERSFPVDTDRIDSPCNNSLTKLALPGLTVYVPEPPSSTVRPSARAKDV